LKGESDTPAGGEQGDDPLGVDSSKEIIFKRSKLYKSSPIAPSKGDTSE